MLDQIRVPLVIAMTLALSITTTFSRPSLSQSSLPAFPGAEGWGAQALQTCDRHRFQVLEVTNLENSGRGSLREALRTNGPRVVIFRVAGIIRLNSTIDLLGDAHSCLIVAGQTAPGAGITIAGSALRLQGGVHDVVLRYIRFRTNTNSNMDIHGGHDIIVDRSSFSWTTDDSFDIWRADTSRGTPISNVTVQRSIHTEIFYGHSTAMNIGGEHSKQYEREVERISIHHNLFGNDTHRNPNLSTLQTSFVNNIVYNWKYKASISKMGAEVDFIGNYYKPGPMSDPQTAIVHESTDENRVPFPESASIYVAQNVRWPDFVDEAADNWRLLEDSYLKQPLDPKFKRTPWQPLAPAPIPISVQSPVAAYQSIVGEQDVGANARLDCSDNWVRNQDVVDARFLRDAANGTQWFSYRTGSGTYRPPANLEEAGDYPAIEPGMPCQDRDHDGMPDNWEWARGLDPTVNDSALDRNADGYTNIEEYINGMSVARGTSAIFSAEADARVKEADADGNFGNSYLRADGGSDPEIESYLRFMVANIAGVVQSAKLRVYAFSNTSDGPALYPTSNSWSESGITWGNRPARTSDAVDDKGMIDVNSWVEYDVTPLVSGNGTYSFVLASTTTDGINMSSREGERPPELVVVSDSASVSIIESPGR